MFSSTYAASVQAAAQVPRQVFLILFIEFFGTLHMRMSESVMYQLLQNEYGMSEVDVASLQAVTSPIALIAGICGAPLIDIFGVRRVVLVSLTLGTLMRGLFAFTSSRLWMIMYVAVPSEGLVPLALYVIALKDLTTSRTRPMAFALSTNLLNLGVVASLNLVELLRPFDLRVGGMLFSGLRLSLVAATLLTLLELLLVYLFVFDLQAVETTGSSAAAADPTVSPSARQSSSLRNSLSDGDDGSSPEQRREQLVPPWLRSSPARSTISGQSYLSSAALTSMLPFAGRASRASSHAPATPVVRSTPSAEAAIGAPATPGQATAQLTMPSFVVVPKRPPGLRDGLPRPAAVLRGLAALVRMERFWRLATYDIFMTGARNQWAQMTTLLVTFLTRAYGEQTPAYAIRSINPLLLTVAPAVLAPLVAHLDAFDAILPALHLFCAASLPMAVAPSVASAVLWMALSGVGEAFWAPRSRAWTTEQAPAGQEAVFLTIVGLVPFLPRQLALVLNGWLNAAFLPNCRGCRDSVGHFCDRHAADTGDLGDGLVACVSRTHEACAELGPGTVLVDDTCPSSCGLCPGWSANPHAMFAAVLAMSLSSPLLITLALPWLRGHQRQTKAKGAAGELF